MVKKSAGLVIVLLANILLVAHSVLPHQHDGGFALIPADHHENHNDPAGIHTEDAEHKHQDHDQDQSCLLAQSYLVPLNSFRLACPLADHLNQNLDFQLIFSDLDHSGYLPSFYKIPVPPLLTPGKLTLPATGCSGLRAPPAI